VPEVSSEHTEVRAHLCQPPVISTRACVRGDSLRTVGMAVSSRSIRRRFEPLLYELAVLKRGSPRRNCRPRHRAKHATPDSCNRASAGPGWAGGSFHAETVESAGRKRTLEPDSVAIRRKTRHGPAELGQPCDRRHWVREGREGPSACVETRPCRSWNSPSVVDRLGYPPQASRQSPDGQPVIA